MPTKMFDLPKSSSAESVSAMADALGKVTGTVVVCKQVILVQAAEPVLKALEALLPIAKGGRKKKLDEAMLPEGAEEVRP